MKRYHALLWLMAACMFMAVYGLIHQLVQASAGTGFVGNREFLHQGIVGYVLYVVTIPWIGGPIAACLFLSPMAAMFIVFTTYLMAVHAEGRNFRRCYAGGVLSLARAKEDVAYVHALKRKLRTFAGAVAALAAVGVAVGCAVAWHTALGFAVYAPAALVMLILLFLWEKRVNMPESTVELRTVQLVQYAEERDPEGDPVYKCVFSDGTKCTPEDEFVTFKKVRWRQAECLHAQYHFLLVNNRLRRVFSADEFSRED
ncbi:MAG: hypothetical protein IJ343_00705 [Clostridia bacterium]|nr:hypothetical protein [Clostridia bacterium]